MMETLNMMEKLKIIAKQAEEESRARRNGRVYTAEQLRHRIRMQEGDTYPFSENGTFVVPRKLFGIDPRTKITK